jgi:hypothetical protein
MAVVTGRVVRGEGRLQVAACAGDGLRCQAVHPSAAVQLDGRMVDAPVVLQAKRVLGHWPERHAQP